MTNLRLIDPINGPLVVQITNESKIQALKMTVLSFWPNRKSNFSPVPLPTSLERKNFYKLKQFPYLICVKSDGIRFLLFRQNNIVYLVDRSFTFYIISLNFINNETNNQDVELMLDGELIKTKDNRWSYIAHDCVVADFKDISQLHFDVRYEAIKDILINRWCGCGIDSGSDSLYLTTKKFYKFSEIDNLINDMSSGKINHKTDGLIFTPLTLGIGTQTQYTLFKWKDRAHHTFDFKIIETPTEYVAYVNQGTDDKKYASVDKKTKEGLEFTRLLKLKCPTFKNGSIVELDYNIETNCFEPKMIRTDKNHPNSLFTIEKTLKNVEENITLENIVHMIKS